MKSTKILIADDHSIVRYGLMLLIKKAFVNTIFFEADTFHQTKVILSEQDIDLLILDVVMPGGDNIKMVEGIKIKWPDTKILMFSVYPEQLYAVRYMQLGVDGYLNKDVPEYEIKRAVELVLSGKTYMSESVKDNAIYEMINRGGSRNDLNLLSNRELDVARLLIKGVGIIEIASVLNLHTSTVSTYKKRIFEKLKANNLTEFFVQFNELESLLE